MQASSECRPRLMKICIEIPRIWRFVNRKIFACAAAGAPWMMAKSAQICLTDTPPKFFLCGGKNFARLRSTLAGLISWAMPFEVFLSSFWRIKIIYPYPRIKNLTSNFFFGAWRHPPTPPNAGWGFPCRLLILSLYIL